MSKQVTTAALTICLSVQGCFAHVRLPPAPDRGASLAVRVAAYRRYHAVVGHQPAYAMADRTTSGHLVTLGDGARVVFPEDLTPMVGPTSATARAAASSASLRRVGLGLTNLGVGALLLAVVPLLVGFATDRGSGSADAERDVSRTAMYAFSLSGLAFVAAGTFAFMVPSRRAGVEAFDAYDGSLRERLGLCGEGAQLLDCDAPRARPPDRDPSPERPVPSSLPPSAPMTPSDRSPVGTPF